MPKHIRITPYERFGNQMLQHMLALSLQTRVPEARISGTNLPEWGIVSEIAPPQGGARLTIASHQFDFERTARWLAYGDDIDVDILKVSCRYEYYRGHLPLYRSVFKAGEIRGGQPDEIVFCIRGGDILEGAHPNYIPMPLSLYEELLQETGLRPVFIGEIGDEPYARALRKRFPNARILDKGQPFDDFQFIRSSTNIVLPIGTFAWLAAWLSETAERIFLPVAGQHYPVARPPVDLLPRDDPRYIFLESQMLSWSASAEELDRLITADASAFGFRIPPSGRQ